MPTNIDETTVVLKNPSLSFAHSINTVIFLYMYTHTGTIKHESYVKVIPITAYNIFLSDMHYGT